MHRLTVVDPETRQAMCSACGPVSIVSKGWQHGKRRWVCGTKHEHKRYATRLGKHPHHWSGIKGTTCERCGFVPEHSVQLDLHNHRLKDKQETLCANCHRLVTLREG